MTKCGTVVRITMVYEEGFFSDDFILKKIRTREVETPLFRVNEFSWDYYWEGYRAGRSRDKISKDGCMPTSVYWELCSATPYTLCNFLAHASGVAAGMRMYVERKHPCKKNRSTSRKRLRCCAKKTNIRHGSHTARR